MFSDIAIYGYGLITTPIVYFLAIKVTEILHGTKRKIIWE